MKRCTYCGKEYPDEVTACTLDGQPLEAAQPPESPKPPLAVAQPWIVRRQCHMNMKTLADPAGQSVNDRASSSDAKFSQSTFQPLAILIVTSLIGPLLIASRALGDGVAERVLPIVGIGLCIAALLALFKTLHTLLRGSVIIVHSEVISCGQRFGALHRHDPKETSWHYVPYVGRAHGLFAALSAALFPDYGLFLKFRDGGIFRLCPLVFSEKKAKSLLTVLSRYIGRVPDYAVCCVDTTQTGQPLEAELFLTDEQVTIGGGATSSICLSRLTEPSVCVIAVDAKNCNATIANKSRETHIEYDYTKRPRKILAPGQTARVDVLPFGTEGWGRQPSMFGFNDFLIFIEVLSDKVLHKAPNINF